ncbi:hypothetical protein BGZ94_000630 [Podila epigama]|nr:hypothetical protein BGZ94_000630 [Podila epigama]
MPMAPRATARPRQTYGRQRSHLGEEDETTDTFVATSSLQSPRKSRSISSLEGTMDQAGPGSPPLKVRSLSRGSSQLSIKESQDIANSAKASLRASHELREAGQNNRFRDEIGYILEGLFTKDRTCFDQCPGRTFKVLLFQAGIWSRYTNNFMKTRIQYVLMSNTQGIMAFEWDHADISTLYQIVSSSLVLLLGIIVKGARNHHNVLALPNIIPYLCESLESDMDSMSIMPKTKPEIALYNDLKALIRQSGLIQKGQQVLTKSIVLSIITSIVVEAATMRDRETLAQFDQFPGFYETVVGILAQDIAWIKQPSYSPDIMMLSDVLDIGRIACCLQILERFSHVSKRSVSVLADQVTLYPQLVRLVAFCRIHAFKYPQNSGKSSKNAKTESLDLMLNVLRLLVNMTNNFEPCCVALANSDCMVVLVQNIVRFYEHRGADDLVQSGHGGNASRNQTKSIDRPTYPSHDNPTHHGSLTDDGMTFQRAQASTEDTAQRINENFLLSIGILTNMFETNIARREQFMQTEIALDCDGTGHCLHNECHCRKNSKVIERLAEIYNAETADENNIEPKMFATYLALLLGSIVEGNLANGRRLRDAMEGKSLLPMIQLLNHFCELYQDVHAGLQERESDDEKGVERQEEDTLEDELFMTPNTSQEGSLSLSGTPSSSQAAPMSLDMPMSLEMDTPAAPISEAPDDSNNSSTIEFSDPKESSSNAIKSFRRIIQVLSDIESMHKETC